MRALSQSTGKICVYRELQEYTCVYLYPYAHLQISLPNSRSRVTEPVQDTKNVPRGTWILTKSQKVREIVKPAVSNPAKLVVCLPAFALGFSHVIRIVCWAPLSRHVR